MQLYSYFRSSTSFRVRIALNLKGLTYSIIPINLRHQDHLSPSYLAINPQGIVPTLIDQGRTLTQSLAILEYLEEHYPNPALLPSDPFNRAEVRSVAHLIGCDIHPLNNLKVLMFLESRYGLNDDQKSQWYHHWIHHRFHPLEQLLLRTSGHFCFSNQISLADVCLIPQVYNAIRFQVDLTPYPTISSIYSHCLTLPSFIHALPEHQTDWQE
ncbi:MAG TPA: maleylacetoacetate isomerase [Candidatus Nitrosotenuis sp.]|nr:maleylacetoacetate isomerase [Candidatus Nitrosotenuis sp.]